jgi:hypothetical protein
MITIHVHQFEELVKKKITSLKNFEWLKETRFCFDDDNEEVECKMEERAASGHIADLKITIKIKVI